MGHSSYHTKIIEEATSQEQLITSGSSHQLQDGYYRSLSRQPPETNRLHSQHGVIHKSDSDTSYCQTKEPAMFSIKDPREVPPAARQAFKNLIVLGCAFMLLFTAFTSLQSLQSTLNHDVGLVSLSCLYGATVFSCFFAPAVIGRFTTKWTMVLSYSVFCLYFLSNFLPQTYIMIPSSLLLGLSTGPMWSAQSTYLTTLAIRYAQISFEVHDFTINKFNGVFCAMLQTSQIWGNLLSAGVLAANNDTVYTMRENKSVTHVACGARDCGPHDYFPDNSISHYISHVPAFTHNLLLSIHVLCAVIAIGLTSLFLDRNHMNISWDKGSISASSQQLFLSTVCMLKDSRLQALSPLVLFTGVEQGFILGDFTKVIKLAYSSYIL